MKTDQSRMILQGETQTTSQQSLENCLTRTALLFSRVLTVEEIQVWKGFLETYSASAIEYAFENWQRNGHFFPKPAQILELIRAYHIQHRSDYVQHYEHHGEGYGETDVLILWKMYQAMSAQVGGRKLTKKEKAALMDELDKKRESVPEWRRSA